MEVNESKYSHCPNQETQASVFVLKRTRMGKLTKETNKMLQSQQLTAAGVWTGEVQAFLQYQHIGFGVDPQEGTRSVSSHHLFTSL